MLNGIAKATKWRSSLFDSLLGILLCCWTALSVAIIYFGEQPPILIPLGFVVVIACVARWFGAVAAMAGCVGAALIFALVLYAPVGSLMVAERSARTNLAWMVLLGFCVARLFFPADPQQQRNQSTSQPELRS